MLTYVNGPEFEMTELQLKAMDTWLPGLRKCLGVRFIVVAVDKSAYRQCLWSSVANCALVEIPGLDLFSTQFSCGFYAFSFFKYALIQAALSVIEEMFFFDADVLLFRSPWIDDNGLYKISDGHRVEPTYDFMFQRINAYNKNCEAGDVNGGQYYLRNSSKMQQFLSTMIGFKHVILNYTETKFDQAYVETAMNMTNLRVCGLDPHRFASGRHVFMKGTTAHAPASGIVSFHFNALNGSARIARMRKFMERMIVPNISLGSIFTSKIYYSNDALV